MKLNVVRRIIVEDFATKDQQLVGKLASSINQFIEQVVQGFNKNLTIDDNLPFDIKTVNITTDVNGIPDETIAIKIHPSIKIRGLTIINAVNIQDSTALVSAPFAQWTIINGLLTITRVLGLPTNKKHAITMFLIG